MKKFLFSVALVMGISYAPTFTADAHSISTEVNAETTRNTVTLVKRFGSGSATTKLLNIPYKIEDGNVYIYHGDEWHLARESNMSGYSYMVDLGGRSRNNVWYFNL
ncbi:MAG: hypothetical protein K2J12_01870 [Muribaculaceae bacterium]|nr:hypothetical protein [Muribaculaceae bacterium]